MQSETYCFRQNVEWNDAFFAITQDLQKSDYVGIFNIKFLKILKLWTLALSIMESWHDFCRYQTQDI